MAIFGVILEDTVIRGSGDSSLPRLSMFYRSGDRLKLS